MSASATTVEQCLESDQLSDASYASLDAVDVVLHLPTGESVIFVLPLVCDAVSLLAQLQAVCEPQRGVPSTVKALTA